MRTNTLVRLTTDVWLTQASPSMTRQMAASMGSSSLSRSTLGSLMLASKSERSISAKYDSQPFRFSHGIASSLSPFWTVFFACCSIWAYVCVISSSTRAHAASLSVGTGCGSGTGWAITSK
jgi:hypothetical protein